MRALITGLFLAWLSCLFSIYGLYQLAILYRQISNVYTYRSEHPAHQSLQKSKAISQHQDILLRDKKIRQTDLTNLFDEEKIKNIKNNYFMGKHHIKSIGPETWNEYILPKRAMINAKAVTIVLAASIILSLGILYFLKIIIHLLNHRVRPDRYTNDSFKVQCILKENATEKQRIWNGKDEKLHGNNSEKVTNDLKNGNKGDTNNNAIDMSFPHFTDNYQTMLTLA